MATKPYNFVAAADGEDATLRGGTATRYGGVDDTGDNGVGAGGYNTALHPTFRGLALPMRSSAGGLTDSPLLRMPLTHPDGTGGMRALVYSRKTGRSVLVQVEDIGPSRYTGRVADLTNAVVLALGHTLAEGTYPVDIRIFGGARYLAKS